jgi:hypothetical protein
MIPFERQPSLTDSERAAEEILEANWENVVRSTPGIVEDLEERYSRTAEEVSRRIMEDCSSKVSSVFRPGVPDFLVFSDRGDYKFVEVKSGDDGIRNSQLRWLRDFEGINAEIWFMESGDVDEKLDTQSFNALSFGDAMGSDEGSMVNDRDGLEVELPGALASVLGIETGDRVEWRLKSSSELILDTK